MPRYKDYDDDPEDYDDNAEPDRQYIDDDYKDIRHKNKDIKYTNDISNENGEGLNLNFLVLVCGVLVLILICCEVYEWLLKKKPKNTKCKYYSPINHDCEDTKLGPLAWKNWEIYAGENSQSPINLLTNDPVTITYYPPLNWSREYMETPLRSMLVHMGNTVILENTYKGSRPYLEGGPLKDRYCLIAIKFKWGANDHEGTEHAIDNCRYAMELQAVHLKINYQHMTSRPAVMESDAVVIVSYLYEVSEFDNPYFETILENLPSVKLPDEVSQINPFPVCWLCPRFCSNFFTYSGSLTIPPCNEGVRWIIQAETLGISNKQVRQFRKLYSKRGSVIMNNCRPLQLMNARAVLFYL